MVIATDDNLEWRDMQSKRLIVFWKVAAAKASALALVLLLFDFGLRDAPSTVPVFQDVGGMAHAQSDRVSKKRGTEKKRRGDKDRREYPNLRSTVFDKLAAIEKAMNEENDKEKALKIVNDMLRRGKRDLNGHELAQVHKMAGWVWWEMGDIQKTIEHYHAVIVDREVIPEAIEQSTLYNLAQLYFQEEDFDKTIELVNEWLSLIESPTARAYYFLAVVYSRMEEWDRTEMYVNSAIEMEQETGKKIPKSWWDLLLLAYYNQENLNDSARILEILVQEYPSARYWKQLAAMYYELGDTWKQIGALEAAHAGGYLDDGKSVKHYASVLLNDGVAYRAAKYYQKGFDDGLVEENFRNHRLLAQSYMMALERDKAIATYKIAAPEAPDGAVFASLGRLLLGTGQFKECIGACENAIEKGDVKRLEQVYLVKGSCYVELEQLKEAKDAFTTALRIARKRDEKSSVRMAQNWLKYIASETKRLQALADLAG